MKKRWADPAYKERLRKAHSGHKISEDGLRRLREANLGKKASPETLKKLRDSHLGLVVSDETRQKISDYNKRVKRFHGKANPSYRGFHSDQVHAKYDWLHRQLAKTRGPASNHSCIGCGKKARDWSSDTEEYQTLEEFSPRCKRCHVRHDLALHKQRQINANEEPNKPI